MLEAGRVVERIYTDIETSQGAFPYEELELEKDAFAVIAREALAAGIGARGASGRARATSSPRRS